MVSVCETCKQVYSIHSRCMCGRVLFRWSVEFVLMEPNLVRPDARRETWTWEGDAELIAEAIDASVRAVISAKEYGGMWRIVRVINVSLLEDVS